MGLEQIANYQLNKYPVIKMVKRCYQLLMYTLSSKMRFKGNILRVSPYNKAECFWGITINHHGMLLAGICFA